MRDDTAEDIPPWGCLQLQKPLTPEMAFDAWDATSTLFRLTNPGTLFRSLLREVRQEIADTYPAATRGEPFEPLPF